MSQLSVLPAGAPEVRDRAGITWSVVVGSPRPGSRTLSVARRASAAIHSGLCQAGLLVAEPDLIDLSQLLPDLGSHLARGATEGRAEPAEPVTHAVARARASRLLVVCSPTFQGSYSGVLKIFLELLPRSGLAGSVAVPVMTAAFSAHRYVGDSHLRPLLVELGAHVPTRTLSVLERDFDRLDEAMVDWLSENLPVLGALLATR